MQFLWAHYNFVRKHIAIGMTPAENAEWIAWFGFRHVSNRIMAPIML